VSIERNCSTKITITHGVPQRSSLGPLLFFIYINDLLNAIKSTPRLFADDTCIIEKEENLNQLETKLNSEIEDILLWCNANKLTINPTKCNKLVIPPKTNSKIANFNIFVKNEVIPDTITVKYLGVIIDSNLTFEHHIKALEIKMSKAFGIICKLKTMLPKEILLKLYYALVHPHLLHGLLVWRSTYPSYLKKLIPCKTKLSNT